MSDSDRTPVLPLFEMQVEDSVLDLLSSEVRLTAIGFIRAAHGLITHAYLTLAGGRRLRLSERMVDLAERLEVGQLVVEDASSSSLPDGYAEVFIGKQEPLQGHRLRIATEQGQVDSGLQFCEPNGDRLTVVAGAYPFTLTVATHPETADFGEFQPEYDLDQYRKVPMK